MLTSAGAYIMADSHGFGWMMKTFYIIDRVIDEHFRLMFHNEVHSSSKEKNSLLLQWFSAQQIGFNTFKQHTNKYTNKQTLA